MSIKLGDFVRVKQGVSNRVDENSVRMARSKEGLSRSEFVGHTGTVVQIGDECLDYDIVVGDRTPDGLLQKKVKASEHIVGFGPITCPAGHEGCVLVDAQVRDGMNKSDGRSFMREWFKESDLEVVSPAAK